MNKLNIQCKVLLGFIILLLIYLICYKLNIKFDNFISGYGFSKIVPTNINNNVSSIIPNNLITKSNDFKLLSLINQINYRFIQPQPSIINTNKGLISNGISSYANIIILPGNCDYKLKQNNKLVWPRDLNVDFDIKEYTNVSNNNDGHMNPIFTLLNALKYVEGTNLNIITYNFINFNIDSIVKQFKSFIKNNTLIIAYDFGCIMANICINYLNKYEKLKISKLLYICPTNGGIPLSIKDYFEDIKYRSFKSLLLSFPQKEFYENPVVIYNSIGYKAQYIGSLIEKINESTELYKSLTELNQLSTKNPEIDCIIVTNNQYNTPTAYNYKNDLLSPPETYLPENNNLSATNIPSPVLVGLQSPGDQVVPFSNITKLKELWKDNVSIEIIKNKNHFSILKSYELGLLITTLI
ncbi:MAG: hypothetical protein ACYS26_22615 [Planctomycetota bacterium]|jgi:hypothetical protein